MTEEKANILARETAIAVGQPYCVVMQEPQRDGYQSYSAEYTAYALLKGDLRPDAVAALYSATGERLKCCGDEFLT